MRMRPRRRLVGIPPVAVVNNDDAAKPLDSRQKEEIKAHQVDDAQRELFNQVGDFTTYLIMGEAEITMPVVLNIKREANARFGMKLPIGLIGALVNSAILQEQDRRRQAGKPATISFVPQPF